MLYPNSLYCQIFLRLFWSSDSATLDAVHNRAAQHVTVYRLTVGRSTCSSDLLNWVSCCLSVCYKTELVSTGIREVLRVDLSLGVVLIWFDLSYGDLIWVMLIWFELCWFDLSCVDLSYVDLIWVVLIWVMLIWVVLIWFELCWFDLNCVDLIWFELCSFDLI